MLPAPVLQSRCRDALLASLDPNPNPVPGDLNSSCCAGLPAEVVLFTAGLEDYAAPICNALDDNYRCGSLSSSAETPVGMVKS